MARVAAAKRQGTSRAGRWCLRALLVVGGAAAAWAISAASASAETEPTPPPAPTTGNELTPVTQAAIGGVNDVSWGATDLVGATSGAVSHAWRQANPAAATARPTIPAKQRVHRVPGQSAADQNVADEVSGAAHEFAENTVLHPVERTLGAVEQIVRKPQDAPKVIDQTLSPPLKGILHPGAGDLIKLPGLPWDHAGQPVAPVGPQPAGPAPTAPPIFNLPAAPAGHAPPAEFADGSRSTIGDQGAATRGHHRGHHRGQQVPFSPKRAPLTPLSVPALPGGSSTANGHVDGPLLGIPAPAMTAVDSAATGSARFGTRHVPVQPGSQPGVKPD